MKTSYRKLKWNRLNPSFKAAFFLLTFLFIGSIAYSQNHSFVHPGIPWTINDLDQMKANRTVYPWSEGWDIISNSSQASLSYTMQGPAVNVDRNDNNITNDGNAALYHALQWYFTGNSQYAENAIDILEAWATTHQTWSGNSVHLHAAWRGGTMVKAAEILRHTYAGWTSTNTAHCEDYFKNVYWPQFRLPNPLRAANQGANNLWGAIQVAIFCNDQTMFEQCIDAFLNDACGGISNTLPNGQNGDTGRDQGHAGGMIGNLVSVAEIAWSQGIDLYSVLDNRLLKVNEYWSKYNSGESVEWIDHGTCYNYFTSIGSDNRDPASPHVVGMMEKIYGAYVVRKGISAPYTSAYRDGIPFDENTFLFRKNSAYNSSASQSNLLDQEFTFSNVTSLTGTDIGSTGVSGSNNYSGSTWTVNGSGGDLYGGNSTDAFRFAYTQMSGDGAFIAQISSIENTSSNAKAAIVIRESLSSNAKMAAVYGRAGNGYEFTSRGFDAADGSGGLGVSASSLPIWIKIERRGDNIVGYVGPDGVSWSAMQNTVFSMSNNYYIGLGVAANSNSELCTSVFTNVKVSSGYSSPGFDAFSQIEAEDYSGQSGIQTENTSDTGGGQNVGWIDDGDWLRFDDVDFDNGAESVDVRVASSSSGGTVEFRLGSTSGTLLGTAVVPVTGGWQTWTTVSADISGASGTQDLYVVFAQGGININWFEFTAGTNPVGTNIALNGTATQSSTAYSGVASRAIDGNTSGNWSDGSVTHTAADTSNPWWEVDLGGTFDIDNIDIYNRTNCCLERLSNFTVSVIDGSTTTFSQTFASHPDPSISIDAGGAIGDLVRVQINGTGTLSLAEVEVYGTPGTSCASFSTIQAEDFNNMSGVVDEGSNVGYIQDGDWVMYSNIDLTCAASIDVRASSPTNGGNVEVRLGSSTGTLIGTVSVSTTGSWNNWSTFSASINSTSGQQDVYLVFTGGSGYLFNLDWLEFSASSSSRIASGFETAETLEGESGISVYPNPVADRLTVLTPSSDFDQYAIYALNGQVVQQGSIARDIKELSIDFTALEKGVYILKLKGIHSDKQVKIHKQ